MSERFHGVSYRSVWYTKVWGEENVYNKENGLNEDWWT